MEVDNNKLNTLKWIEYRSKVFIDIHSPPMEKSFLIGIDEYDLMYCILRRDCQNGAIIGVVDQDGSWRKLKETANLRIFYRFNRTAVRKSEQELSEKMKTYIAHFNNMFK